MKTLALDDGDLVISSTGHATISGTTKITTELSLALAEPYGDDRFHRQWGSYLPSYIGMNVDPTTQMLIEAEVQRVLANYIYIQRSAINQDALDSRRSRFSTADVVASVVSVQTSISLDTIFVKIILRTQAGQDVTIQKAVNI